MSNYDSKSDMKKDDRVRALESNSCGMCRAMGSPICCGHGAGGSGSSHSTANDDTSCAKSILPMPKITANATSITQSLTQNVPWSLVDGADLMLKFTDPNALLSIALDMESGSLVFRSNRELSQEEQKAQDELFNAIENELILFKSKLTEKKLQVEPIKVARDRNTLSIKISDPQHYDLFIQRLIDKNLLPNKAAPLQQQQNECQQSTFSKSAETMPEENKLTAPTPFNIRGPRPNG
ncbi:Uncharacterised protein [Legionella beliardensis]|uniref:Uncharacterized protein n=1 Tax=Legionella beliardensis TaxID=91822 RepID=A0A378I4Z6_9GAMM|nr:hypothetical protein [Legionella beliardensis]STX29795.1 Uncharacterised protein [Legionella beliardensis]